MLVTKSNKYKNAIYIYPLFSHESVHQIHRGQSNDNPRNIICSGVARIIHDGDYSYNKNY